MLTKMHKKSYSPIWIDANFRVLRSRTWPWIISTEEVSYKVKGAKRGEFKDVWAEVTQDAEAGEVKSGDMAMAWGAVVTRNTFPGAAVGVCLPGRKVCLQRQRQWSWKWAREEGGAVLPLKGGEGQGAEMKGEEVEACFEA
jgi:hypothetical protein